MWCLEVCNNIVGSVSTTLKNSKRIICIGSTIGSAADLCLISIRNTLTKTQRSEFKSSVRRQISRLGVQLSSDAPQKILLSWRYKDSKDVNNLIYSYSCNLSFILSPIRQVAKSPDFLSGVSSSNLLWGTKKQQPILDRKLKGSAMSPATLLSDVSLVSRYIQVTQKKS